MLPDGLAEPGAGIAVAMLTFILLAIFGVRLAYNTYFHVAAGSWQKVPATVIGIVNHPRSTMLRYSYNFRSQDFTGDRYQYFSTGTVPESTEINERFQLGDTMMIRVDPDKPSRSVVQWHPFRLEQIIPDILIIGFTLIASAVFFFRRRGLIAKAH